MEDHQPQQRRLQIMQVAEIGWEMVVVIRTLLWDLLSLRHLSGTQRGCKGAVGSEIWEKGVRRHSLEVTNSIDAI